MPDGSTQRIIHGYQGQLGAWVSEGLELGERERSSRSLLWDIGDWWRRGEPYGERAQIVTAGNWTGPVHGTCRYAASVARRWPVLCRHNTLGFEHHRAVAMLPDEQAIPLLDWCAEIEPARTVQELRAEVKRVKRAKKERELGARTRALPGKLYNVIYADPPWRFEPYSRDSGMDRAADNHYPTMTIETIKALRVPAADDAVLFMWATVPLLVEALDVLAVWGFAYKSHFIWAKDRSGTGYWNRNRHELLLVGTRGDIPAPAPGEQFTSVIEAPIGDHSVKPAAFAEMIEEMFPHLPSVELFARGPRLGWDVWGNEAEKAA